MGLFGRGRRYTTRSVAKKKRRVATFFDYVVWAVEPDTAREIIAVFLMVLGLLFALGLFGLAGQFGDLFFRMSVSFFGPILAYVVPFAFLFGGLKLWRVKNELIRASSLIGVVLVFFFLPALFLEQGGSIGRAVYEGFSSVLGSIGGYVAILGLAVVGVMLSLNISVRSLIENLRLPLRDGGPGVKINDTNPRVPVKTMTPTKITGPVAPVVFQTAGDHGWQLPSLELLDYADSTKAEAGNIGKNVELIKKTLKDFSIEVTMHEVNVGPTLTQYTLKPTEGVKLSNITARSNDIALALAAHPIRIEAPIPGKSLVGVEVPNKVAATVSLREVLEAEEYKDLSSNLSVALGRDVAGQAIGIDLKKMPHLLVAGATGSGKSVCINSLLVNLLYRNSPAELRLLLIDPKRVEFVEYNGIAHLLTGVVTETDKIISSLRWTVSEMERRYQLLASSNRRNIDAFNDNPPEGHQKLPYILVVIDELADLMTQAANEVEASIVRIAQMARAVGIHLVVATQRPSVDVITGLIKANIPARIAFAVPSQADSRTILDQAGADKLLGRGDMLLLNSETPQPKRIQGVFVKDKEIHRVSSFVRDQAPAVYDDTIQTYRTAIGSVGKYSSSDDEADELFNEAKELVIQAGKASASLLQRRLKVGYARAARLLDLLEAEGVIGPADGAKPRDVLIQPDEYQGP